MNRYALLDVSAAFLAAALFLWTESGIAGVRQSQAPEVVAVLDVDSPALPAFVLHGTIPVPPGIYPRADGLMPFSILDHDGTPVPTQVEIVSKYPTDVEGADVIEVLGRVNVPPGTFVGARLTYKVVEDPHTKTFLTADPETQSMLNTPGSLMIMGRDCFGHQYGAFAFIPGRQPFGSGAAEVVKNGAGARTVKTYGVMLPATTEPIGAPTGALPHFFGVHSYVTTWHGEDVITLDLRFNNGPSNHDKQNSIDNILGDVYYESLELWVPQGWTALQQGSDPLFGAFASQGTTHTSISIVAPVGGGKMHLFPSQGQFHRRLAICKVGNEAKAQQFLDERMLGFCNDGLSPNGQRYYSWWNPQTARYFPQRYVLPNLDHVLPALKTKYIESVLVPTLAAVKSGTIASSGGVDSPKLGYAHPWGAPYGGVTGGTEIWMFDGIVTADTASQRGYLLSSITHRLYQDRQPDVLYNKTGAPTCVEDWLQQSPNGLHTGMNFYETLRAGPDPFGFAQADPFQVNYVKANGLQPPYEAALRNYSYIDLQHTIRTTRSAKVLAWLGNDPLAKDDLRMRAELFRLGFHQYNNSANGSYAGGGLKGIYSYATKFPGNGLGIGRGGGWGLDTTNCAYAFGDASYRAKLLPWYGILVDALSGGQFQCSGFIMAKQSDKVLGGIYKARQQYEHAIMENAWRGALETALRGADPAHELAMEAVIGKATQAMISPMSWDPVQRGPWGQLAVSSLTQSGAIYCGLPHPIGGHSTGVDKFQCWSSFAYGFDVTGDANFITKAGEMLGGDVRAKLLAGGLNNLENRAALLALAQQP